MNKNRGLFIGLTTIDIQYFVEEYPEINTKIKTNPPDILIGGPATNASIAFSYLNNGNAFLASPTGFNSFGKFIQDKLQDTNVKHVDLIKNQNSSPVIATVVTSLKNGERNIFTHHPEIIKPEISAEEMFDNIKPDIILLDGFYPEFGIDCAKLASEKNIPVVLDCGSWKPQYENLFVFADIVICSHDFYPPGCHNSDDVIHFLENKNVNKIAVSRGEKSILFSSGKRRGEVTVKNVQVADTLGAGDFLHGAFCYFYSQNRAFEESLKSASEFATFTCKFNGPHSWLNFTK